MILVDSNVPMYLVGAEHPHKRDAQRALERAVTDEVLPITEAEAQRARHLVLGNHELSARDAIHLAVMERHGITRILTLDRGFDDVPGVQRLG